MKSLSWIVAAVLLVSACSKAPKAEAPAVATPPAPAKVAWIHPATAGDADRAFNQAKESNRPVLLFWTAEWCPPCNQVKSTIFSRPEFIEKSRSFVPLLIDGDTPGGQALGKRFNVGGYPTTVLMRADGAEITRLAGSVDPARYIQLLDLGLAGGTSARDTLAAALSGKTVGAEGWRQLAFYSWETDEQQLVPKQEMPSTLLKLARACPAEQRESASRLTLQAIGTSATVSGDVKPAADRVDALASVRSILAQPDLVREHYDLIAYYAVDIVRYTTKAKSKERQQLALAWNAALDALVSDPTLSTGARIWALSGKVDLARLDNSSGTLPDGLVAKLREQIARADRETTDIDERQSVITGAGEVLADAGLLDESDALLKAELGRSHSPYYYMLGLASNARKRGTPESKAAAIDWARQAYETSMGPATRLQWGGAYVNYLLELAPTDVGRIEAAATSVIREAAATPDAFSARSRHSLERMSKRLQKWNKNGRHDATLARLHEQMTPVCNTASLNAADKTACSKLFTPAKQHA